MYDLTSQAIKAKNASESISKLSEEKRNRTLKLSAKLLRENKDYLISRTVLFPHPFARLLPTAAHLWYNAGNKL